MSVTVPLHYSPRDLTSRGSFSSRSPGGFWSKTSISSRIPKDDLNEDVNMNSPQYKNANIANFVLAMPLKIKKSD